MAKTASKASFEKKDKAADVRQGVKENSAKDKKIDAKSMGTAKKGKY